MHFGLWSGATLGSASFSDISEISFHISLLAVELHSLTSLLYILLTVKLTSQTAVNTETQHHKYAEKVLKAHGLAKLFCDLRSKVNQGKYLYFLRNSFLLIIEII